MIDHLMGFADRAAAIAALGALGPDVILNVGGPHDESVAVVLQDEVVDCSDPDPSQWVVLSERVVAAGWYCIVARPVLDPSLRDMPSQACRLIADRDAAENGEPFLLHVAGDVDPQMLATARVEPTPAGARYPLGVV